MDFHECQIFEGERYTCDHLSAFRMNIYSDRIKKNLTIYVRFSNHCYTQEIPKGSRNRVFCPIRWKCSENLPELVRAFSENPSIKVFQTAERRNWVYSLKIETPEGNYHIFFEVRKSTREKRPLGDIQLYVESAYPEDPDLGPPNVIGRMAFAVLCSKIYKGEKVSTKK